MINRNDSAFRPNRGFTITEMIVVIIVIGILATLVIVSYNGISRNARIATLKSDLDGAVKQVQLYYVENRSYPITMPSDVQYSPGVGMSLSEVTEAKTYCINGEIQNGDETLYAYYDSTVGQVQDGACSGNVIEGSQHNIAYNYVRDNSFTSINGGYGTSWWLNTETGGDPLTVRAGTSTDPIPNKPVLVLPNTSATTTAWGAIQGPVDWVKLTGDREYRLSVWVRKTGSFTGDINNLAVADDTGLNETLWGSWHAAPTDSWQYVSDIEIADKSGTSDNLIYLWLNNTAFATSGWTIEIQNPRIIDNI
jgi:prepilin-type N-terminal cleavage/methylation domain-containing protein